MFWKEPSFLSKALNLHLPMHHWHKEIFQVLEALYGLGANDIVFFNECKSTSILQEENQLEFFIFCLINVVQHLKGIEKRLHAEKTVQNKLKTDSNFKLDISCFHISIQYSKYFNSLLNNMADFIAWKAWSEIKR